jgi:hypothetical protein
MRAWQCVVLHFFFITLLFFGYRQIKRYSQIPTEKSWGYNFDSQHYQIMKEHGYQANDTQTKSFIEKYGTNTAFFPGFPYLWRYLKLNTWGISLLNFAFFLTGLFLLIRNFDLSRREVLLFLSLPSQFFFYVPYSESLFFICTVLILLGYKRDSVLLGMAGFFTASLTRSASNIFIPGIIVTDWFTGRFKLKQFVLYIGASLIALGIVMCMLYYQVGDPFAFITAQKFWGHKLQWPKLPFTTWSDMILLDGASLVFGFFVILYLLRIAWFKILKYKTLLTDKAVMFSLASLAGLTMLALAFKGGVLFSLNRYLLPTAFMLIGGAFFYRKAHNLTMKQIFYSAGCIFLFLILFHFFVHIRVILKFLGLTVYITLYLISARENHGKFIITTLLYISNCAIQVYYLNEFLRGIWIA